MHGVSPSAQPATSPRSEHIYFVDQPVENQAKSRESGHAVYDDVPYVVSIHPGTPPTKVVIQAKQKHIDRYPTEWVAYQQKKDAVVDGTRLELWPPLTQAQCATLKAASVFSVEQLSAVSDQQCQAIGMGTLKLKQLAEEWLKTAKEAAPLTELHAKNQDLESKVEQLTKTVADLSAALEASNKKPRGKAGT